MRVPNEMCNGEVGRSMSRYAEVYASWQKDPEGFWANVARDISWYKLWDKPFDPYAGAYGRWFPGAECNSPTIASTGTSSAAVAPNRR